MSMHQRFVSRTYEVEVEPHPSLYTHGSGLDIIRAMFRGLDPSQEHALVVALDARTRVAGHKLIASGTLNQVLLHPREVFYAAIQLKAAQIVVVHTHPSGDPTPSDEDRRCTARLRKCGELIGIPVRWHLVLAGEEFRVAYEPTGVSPTPEIAEDEETLTDCSPMRARALIPREGVSRRQAGSSVRYAMRLGFLVRVARGQYRWQDQCELGRLSPESSARRGRRQREGLTRARKASTLHGSRFAQ